MRKRFTLYGLGFFMGLLMVFFFLGGKRASCNWLPNDRILNIIRQKHIVYSDSVKESLHVLKKDSIEVLKILQWGEVDFSKSKVKNEPCRFYWIQGGRDQSDLLISVELCDSIATVKSLQKINAADQ